MERGGAMTNMILIETDGLLDVYQFEDDPTRHGIANAAHYRQLLLELEERRSEFPWLLDALACALAESDLARRYIRLMGYHPTDDLGIWELVKKVLP